MEDATPIELTTDVIRGILSVIPHAAQGTLALEPLGHSDWARFSRIRVRYEGAGEESFFMKVSIGVEGDGALHGEYEATKLIHSFAPDFCPRPLGTGTFEEGGMTAFDRTQEQHFYICRFYELLPDRVPDRDEFCEKLAALHLRSQELNPSTWAEAERPAGGSFGFHCTTYNGDLPQDNTWADSWEEFFARALRRILSLREERAGCADDELDRLVGPLFDKVIPRLLRPLETEGRAVCPTLIHGDLWKGNAAALWVSEECLVYDPASFWGHHEYELGNWRPPRNGFRDYIPAYLAQMPSSEPAEDWDDRNALYALKFNLQAAAMFPVMEEHGAFKSAKDEIRRLVEKFPDGYVPPSATNDK